VVLTLKRTNKKDAPIISKLIAVRGCTPCLLESVSLFAQKNEMKFSYKIIGNCSGKRWQDFLLNDPVMRVKYDEARLVTGIENQEIVLITRNFSLSTGSSCIFYENR
jgi:hypothetical protein